MLISIPPSGARRSWTSSMKLRMRKMPRPLDFSRFSGSSGFATSLGIEALALIADANRQLRHLAQRRPELDEHAFARVVAVAVFDGVDDRFANRDADPMHGVFVETDSTGQMVAHDLDEIQHLERAGEFEADKLMAVLRHRCVRRPKNTICRVRSIPRCPCHPPPPSGRPGASTAAWRCPAISRLRTGMPCSRRSPTARPCCTILPPAPTAGRP